MQEEEISWETFHQKMRPPSPLAPLDFTSLDVLQPRHPSTLHLALQQGMEMLNTPYPSLSHEDVEMFRSQRWIRLKQVLPPSLLSEALSRITDIATAASNGRNLSLPKDDIYTDGCFDGEPEEYWDLISEPATQSWNIQMMWAIDPLVRALVLSPRIG
jgi:hypothetical protein